MTCTQITFGNDGQMVGYDAPKQRALKDGERRIKTGLVGKKANEVLRSVIGQMSDGLWENYNGFIKYWLFVDIDEDNSIIVQDHGRDWCGRWYGSGWSRMDEQFVRDFFAKRIEAILAAFRKDGKEEPNSTYYHDGTCGYLSYHEDITIDECKAIAKALVNFKEVE